MTKNKYTINANYLFIKIYINNILHLAINKEELIGIQSYIDGFNSGRKYYIEYAFQRVGWVTYCYIQSDIVTLVLNK